MIARIARRADDLAIDRVDLAEGWTHDSLVLLAELAGRTSRVRLGTSVISVWGRSPATIAMAASDLQRASNGRFSLGLGASSPPLVEGFHGIAWNRPVARLRETVIAVRALLTGDRLPTPAGGARPLRLGALPDKPIPIMVAALATESVRLAGELADGWSPFLWSRSRVGEGKALLHEGEARAEAPRPTRVALGVPVALGPDEESARRLAAWWLANYSMRMGPLYPRMLAEHFGMRSGVEAVVAAAEADPQPDLPRAAEELAREVTLFGTYDEAAETIAAWAAAGADDLSLVLPPGRPPEELEDLLEVAAAR